MVDLHLFRQAPVFLSTASAILNYIGVYSVIFLMPFYLIQGRMFTSAEAGLLLTAQPVMMAIIAPLSGTLSDRLGTRWLAMTGMAVLTRWVYFCYPAWARVHPYDRSCFHWVLWDWEPGHSYRPITVL